MTSTTTDTTVDRSKPSPKVPHWLIRTIWMAHRAVIRFTGARLGLRPPTATQWGMLRLTTTGRKSGARRLAIVGYIEDGATLIVPAMNGWMAPDPAWWLNLQANPEASVRLSGGSVREMRARAAIGEERDRLWRRLVDLGSSAYSDANAATRGREAAIVVLEPQA